MASKIPDFFYRFLVLCTIGIAVAGQAICQPKLEIDLKKPKEFENRQLGSEKMADKKFTVVRRFFQNTYTHYNYYFNANNILNEIVDRAQQGHKDDYTELLPFYPWSLEQTAQSKDIDSVLQKCTAGILLHDLRNDWIDNMYLLMGRAYYLRRDFDSAAMAFQYLNYAFAPKAKDGSQVAIGSHSEGSGSAFSVMSKEKKTPVLRRPPSRNDAFVWQVRNYTDRGDFLEASSLLSVLRNDPLFPKRLEPMLFESIAYLNYKQQIWDSAAVYLEKSMPEATNNTEKARRWYLAGQLYQLAGMNQEASDAYAKSTGMALDPVMELYARLNSIRLRKSSDPSVIDKNVADLVAMARRDKYYNYRDIIYYAAALYELERDGYDASEKFLQKSIASNLDNAQQRSMSFFQLAEVRFAQKKYGAAGPPYDSLQTTQIKPRFAALVEERKPGCLIIYKAETAIALQDSLLALANMDEAERMAFVKALSRKLRKERGIKEEEPSEGSMGSAALKNPTDQPTNLFASASTTWYFYEPNIRASGFLTFRERWGARPNVDNWRRSSSLGLTASKIPILDIDSDPDGGTTLVMGAKEDAYDSTDVSFDNLYSRIPISEEKRAAAAKKIIDNLYDKAAALHIKLEDYPEAIKVYEEILRRMDTGTVAINCLKGLVHCYYKTGDRALSQQAATQLQKLLGAEASTDLAKNKAAEEKLLNATYQKIYDLFIEGRFEEALAARSIADSTLGNSYWKPQLLYIQSVYHIKKVEDSLALKELGNITSNFGGHKLSERAKTLADVLKRRKKIEDYLTKLDIKRLEEDEMTAVPVAVAYAAPTAPATQSKEEKEAAEKALLEKLEAERLAGLKAQKDAEAALQAMEQKEKADAAAKAAQAEAARLAAEKALAEQQEADRKAAEAEAAQKAEAERLAAEKALAEKLEAERLAAEKAAAEKAEAERLAAEKALAEKLAAEKEAEAKALAEKQRLEKEAEERALAEKQAADKAKAEKELAEKQAREKAEIEKLAADKAEAERLLAIRQAEEKAALEKEMQARQAAEKEAADKALAEKQAAEKAEELRRQLEKEKAEKEAAEKALAEKQRLEQEADNKAAAEKAAMEKAAMEKALAEKQAAEKAAMEQALAEKEAREKAEAERKRLEREAAEKLAAEKLKAQREAEEKAALARTSMIDNVLVTQPATTSPFSIKANEPQVVAIVLERIDPAYVNEVSYSLGNSPLRNKEGVEVEVIKKKLRDNLWLVELQSPAFTNMQQAYNYIKYIKPIAQDELLTWLDSSKYYFVTISQANLKLLEQNMDAGLYYKILQEAVPNKF